MRKQSGIIGFLFVLVVSTPLAYADIAPTPAPKYDSSCTVEKRQSVGTKCISSCPVSGSGANTCGPYILICTTAVEPGSYSEIGVFCRQISENEVKDAGETDASAEEADRSDNGTCSVAGFARGKNRSTSLFVLGLASLALLRRRRQKPTYRV